MSCVGREPTPVRPIAASPAGVASATIRAVNLRLLACLLLGLPACSTVSDLSAGVSIEVLSESPALPASDGRPSMTNDLGYDVTLSRAYLVTTSLEVFPCQSLAARLWERWIERPAMAHAGEGPTRLGTAVVETLAANGNTLTLGEIRPPPGSYCHARYTAGPADRDAVGLTAGAPIAGNTIYLEGTFARGGDVQPFVASSDASLVADSELAPLTLSQATPRSTLRIRKPIARWFEGVDFANQDERQRTVAILANISRSIVVERQ